MMKFILKCLLTTDWDISLTFQNSKIPHNTGLHFEVRAGSRLERVRRTGEPCGDANYGGGGYSRGGGGSVEAYTFWIATSAWANYEIAGNKTLLDELYPELASNYHNNMFTPNFSKADHYSAWYKKQSEA